MSGGRGSQARPRQGLEALGRPAIRGGRPLATPTAGLTTEDKRWRAPEASVAPGPWNTRGAGGRGSGGAGGAAGAAGAGRLQAPARGLSPSSGHRLGTKEPSRDTHATGPRGRPRQTGAHGAGRRDQTREQPSAPRTGTDGKRALHAPPRPSCPCLQRQIRSGNIRAAGGPNFHGSRAPREA